MKKKTAYLVGIKGVAMTALAVYLKEKGYEVTGSDVEDIFPTDKVLKMHNIKVKKGFTEENVDANYNLVIVTGAHGGMTNIEAQQAKKLQIPTLMHGEYLGNLMKNKFGISIAGCHGKTTTSSLIAFLLHKSGLKPSYAIGTAEINGIGAGGHFGTGDIFVAEADEYMTCPQTDATPRFMWQDPRILVITNIEYDHPDAYTGINEVNAAYIRFVEKLSEETIVIACIDNKNVEDLLPKIKRPFITYGFSPRADFQISRFYFGENASFMRIMGALQNNVDILDAPQREVPDGTSQRAVILNNLRGDLGTSPMHKKIDLGEYMLSIPGKHNMLNALASIIVTDQLGVNRDSIKRNLSLYFGCKRRFEKIGHYGNVLLYDDYAHHPSEIVATLSATREWFKAKRIIVLFQPHTFSRTKALLIDFARAFTDADVVLICDIYPSAREQVDKSINSKTVVMEANKFKNNAYYMKDKEQVLSFLAEHAKDEDLILTMGAGDIYLWHKDLIKLLQKKFS